MLACCAFAVFLLHQLLAPLVFIKERLMGRAGLRRNDAVAWRPGVAVIVSSRGRLALRPAAFALVAIEILAVGGSVAAATLAARAEPGSSERQFLTAMHATICRAVGRHLP